MTWQPGSVLPVTVCACKSSLKLCILSFREAFPQERRINPSKLLPRVLSLNHTLFFTEHCHLFVFPHSFCF